MKSPYDRYWHKASLMPDTPLSVMLKATALQVNSYHHQGIRDLSFQLCPMAYSPDGLVEAFYHSSKKVHVGSAVASRVPVAERPCAANDIPGVCRCLQYFLLQRGSASRRTSEKERLSIPFGSLALFGRSVSPATLRLVHPACGIMTAPSRPWHHDHPVLLVESRPPYPGRCVGARPSWGPKTENRSGLQDFCDWGLL